MTSAVVNTINAHGKVVADRGRAVSSKYQAKFDSFLERHKNYCANPHHAPSQRALTEAIEALR
jgi:predicted double-glycine peptidase